MYGSACDVWEFVDVSAESDPVGGRGGRPVMELDRASARDSSIPWGVVGLSIFVTVSGVGEASGEDVALMPG